MNKPVHGLGKGLGALLGEVDSVQSLRKPIGYVNKEIAGTKEPQDTSDILRIPIDMIEPTPSSPVCPLTKRHWKSWQKASAPSA
ncbi:MAG: hypothetical protein II466_02565 [Bacteroidales bacterium]|nr:hypothetical protein [Bacteroidales bacterium]